MDNWRLANAWGILRDGDPDADNAAFNAGHLNDVLILDEPQFTPVLVASDTSGVWLVNENGGPAIPVSDGFRAPNMNSLAQGPRGTRHVYAGGELLWETDVTQVAPLLNWRAVPIADTNGSSLGAGTIYDIVVLKELQKIVVACDNGIFWADILAPGLQYAFKKVDYMPTGRYSGLAEGPGNTVIAAAWGSDKINHFGLFFGGWFHDILLFQRASVFGSINEKLMLRTSVDSCRTNRKIAYAVAEGWYYDTQGNPMNNTIYRVLRTIDGGQTWRVTGSKMNNESDPLFGDPNKNLPGNQGDYNNCIGVAPFRENQIAIGWRNGFFVSQDGGKTWDMFRNDSPHQHEDLHAVAFSQWDPWQKTLYVCSDGGMAITRDLGQSYTSKCNRQLPNLQLYRLALSYPKAGLLAASLQDNGDDFSLLYPTAAPWHQLEGGDGVEVVFLRNGDLLRYNNTETLSVNGVDLEFGNRVRHAQWNDGKSQFDDRHYFPNDPLSWGVIPVDNTSDGLAVPITEIVNNPRWTNWAGEKCVAVAGSVNKVYGLLLKSDGGVHWSWLLDVPVERDNNGNIVENITGVGSADGTAVFVGTSKGNIFRLLAPTLPSVNWRSDDITPTVPVGSIQRFVIHSDKFIFVTASGRQLLKFQDPVWDQLVGPAGASGDYQGFDTDWTIQPKTLFLATDQSVFASADDGGSWTDISNGLPVMPHCRDLRFVAEISNLHFLYLGTYGRSVFRLLLNASETQERTIKIDGKMDLVDRVAVGHDIWSHPTFSNTVVLGPYHPVEDITIVEDDGDEVRVELKLHLQWFLDLGIQVDHTAKLIAKDEDNAVVDQNSGSVHLNKSDSNTTVIDLESHEAWPDRAHIEFTITN